jgi:hypothetical protein
MLFVYEVWCCGIQKKKNYFEVTKMQSETRVGFVTIDLLCREIEKYINLHVVDGKYIGKVEYLDLYCQFQEYLRSGIDGKDC